MAVAYLEFATTLHDDCNRTLDVCNTPTAMGNTFCNNSTQKYLHDNICSLLPSSLTTAHQQQFPGLFSTLAVRATTT
ncbi:unnamed protein product [Amaranthus hypochondriacus]